MQNIFAMTAPEHSNPEYISVNQDGRGYQFTIRNAGKGDGAAGATAAIILDADQARKLATDLLAFIEASKGR